MNGCNICTDKDGKESGGWCEYCPRDPNGEYRHRDRVEDVSEPTPPLFKIGDRVRGKDECDRWVTGKVAGLTDAYREEFNTYVPCVLVALDRGLYAADKRCFISVLLVHRDSLVKEA